MENDILLFGESEIMVKTLRKFSLEEIGSAAWKRQHEYLNKLNQQSQPGIHFRINPLTYRGVRRKYTERCLQKDTSLWKRVPLKDTTFFRERGPSKRYAKGPVKRYNFFFRRHAPLKDTHWVPLKDTAFFTQSVTPFCYHSRRYTLSSPAERYKFFFTQSATF